jgi:hypothetical protein
MSDPEFDEVEVYEEETIKGWVAKIFRFKWSRSRLTTRPRSQSETRHDDQESQRASNNVAHCARKEEHDVDS